MSGARWHGRARRRAVTNTTSGSCAVTGACAASSTAGSSGARAGARWYTVFTYLVGARVRVGVRVEVGTRARVWAGAAAGFGFGLGFGSSSGGAYERAEKPSAVDVMARSKVRSSPTAVVTTRTSTPCTKMPPRPMAERTKPTCEGR